MARQSRKRKSSNARPTCALISLGCPKNLVDSEQMLGRLQAAGYRWVVEPEGADLVVVNTCGFLDTAREESLAVVRQMAELKRRGRLGGILVAGCMAQRDKEALIEACPEIDQVVGLFARDQIAVAARRTTAENRPSTVAERLLMADPLERAPADDCRVALVPSHVAYLKIAEGCDRLCAFCSIPMIRGRYLSKPIDQVVDEARRLADGGVRELVLIAQDTSVYGHDLADRPRLAELLGRLDRIDSLAWIRLMYLYPRRSDLDDELLDAIASSDRVLPYLDIPLQHIADEVLRRMRRGATGDETRRLIQRIRERISGVVLRTTLLVGFPGETDAQFEELLDFVRRERFDRLGAFAYRREPGTASDQLDGHLPESVKESRYDRLMETQQQIAFELAAARVGRRLDVMIDRAVAEQPGAYVGRTAADAPEVDGLVYVTGDDLRPGQIVPCEIVTTQDYDLIGVAVDRAK
ncbi:MAG: 30S ribosomal protein S12 methylthiotransferase RimO [Pirellulales bacterium]|nr:30S ribosomal protein S12 methylthiotransferase RimO [Pirellulales bacterium]